MTYNVVVICTRNRKSELMDALESISAQTLLPDLVLVVDSSDNFSQIEWHDKFKFIHLQSQKNLTYQRNVALNRLIDLSGESLVHFFDDDVILGKAYIEKIVSSFDKFPKFSGICARTPEIVQKDANIYKRFFMLDSKYSGKILPSGVNVQFRESHGIYEVDWLPGCCMSYRYSAIKEFHFDESRTGVGWGEDVDFSYRLKLRNKLLCDTGLEIIHRLSAVNRDSQLTQFLKVVENRFKLARIPGSRVRRIFILWSILGEIPMMIALKLKVTLLKFEK